MTKKKPHPKIRCPKCGHTFIHGEKIENPVAKNPVVFGLILLTVAITILYTWNVVF